MIRKLRSLLSDSELDYQSKLFVLLSFIALIGLFVAMVSGILLGQSFTANLSVLVEFLLFTAIFLWAVYCNAIKKAMILIAVFLIFIFLPVAFFSSGGAAGGTPLWFAFSTLYIVMTLSGRQKAFFLSANAIVVIVCWGIGYYNPDTITEFSRKEAFYDSFFTLFIIGIVMTAMVGFQVHLFRKENERVTRQKKEIEELNRAQSRFFSSMSHEIRTPINSILGMNEVILRQEDASDEIINDSTVIQSAGKILLALVNDILDFSRIDAGHMDIVPADYKVADMIMEIVSMIQLQAKAKGLEFDVDMDPDMPTVLCGDEIRIRQIIVNLLNNAVKYTESGSVKLDIRTKDTTDEETVIVIIVSDTGIGIKEEVIPVLFDAFTRMDQDKNRKIEGTGLGLSIVKQLVDLMGGKISVDSVYGSGTTFTVEIVQKVSDPNRIGNINMIDRASKTNMYKSLFTAPDARILIVDDIKMNLTVEKKLLRETKIKIDTATSGKEALELTRTNRYDVILMDHLMPEMDGVECLARIRSQEQGACRDVPVVVLTANAEGQNQEIYVQAGFNGRLVKPISGRMLEEALIRFIPTEKTVMEG